LQLFLHNVFQLDWSHNTSCGIFESLKLILYKFPVGGAKEQMWSAYLGNNDAHFSKNISLLGWPMAPSLVLELRVIYFMTTHYYNVDSNQLLSLIRLHSEESGT